MGQKKHEIVKEKATKEEWKEKCRKEDREVRKSGECNYRTEKYEMKTRLI